MKTEYLEVGNLIFSSNVLARGNCGQEINRKLDFSSPALITRYQKPLTFTCMYQS